MAQEPQQNSLPMNPPPQLLSPGPWTVHPLEGGRGLFAVAFGAWGLGAVTLGPWALARWPCSELDISNEPDG